ncbi:uncharacterized protein F5891DRAFT_1235288 [Suillus fuscotomentosus]|uniref:ABC transporter domain-containing protein n=1 Tax=Suillus fuscotomentosus TaxID=1912939 RepID=A0AAD4E445_9AGAM|nr:uncharacterized protein F5891DRAFT_1235288 [Suillus fuscotomentosus]KAG1898982.1 hypothetical protein F5891DRAFT_1235288 [Suillus fuscotomentosus]
MRVTPRHGRVTTAAGAAGPRQNSYARSCSSKQELTPSLSSRFHVPTFIALVTQISQRRSSMMLNGLLMRTLLGHLRITPPPPLPGRLFPFLSDPPRNPHNCAAFVSFAHRPRAAGGAFYDYTSPYGAVREEDRITLRESMFGKYDFLNVQPKGGKVKTPIEIAQDEVKKGIFEGLTSRLGLSSLLDLPLIALSNGQTRRARIVKAILSEPELLVLDEPLTGLDINTRPILLNILRSLHESHSLRIIMGLWIQDPVPDWISHIALVTGETILTGVKDEIMFKHAEHHAKEAEHRTASTTQSYLQSGLDHGKPVVDMKNVNVSYGPHKVLKNIKWIIRAGTFKARMVPGKLHSRF